MGIDRTLKASLTTYDFCSSRGKNGLTPHVPAVHAARNEDEQLIAIINQDMDLADVKMKSGEARAAMQTLRRAYRIAKEARDPRSQGPAAVAQGREPSPASLVAVAIVNLHLCATLSKLGRHQQAVEEAKQGCASIDEVWRIMLTASAQVDEAMKGGDQSKPAQALRNLLTRPPVWLEQAAELTVQCRQALAIEIETLERNGPVFQFQSRSMNQRSMSSPALGSSTGNQSASAAELDCNGEGASAQAATAMKSPTGSWGKEIERIHQEAVMLAQNLLPESHDTRRRAEQAHGEAATRFAQCKPAPSRTDGDTPLLPPLLQMRSRSRLPLQNSVDSSMSMTSSSSSPGGRVPMKSLGASTSASSWAQASTTAPSDGGVTAQASTMASTTNSLNPNYMSYYSCPAGDVFHASVAESLGMGRVARDRSATPSKKKRTPQPAKGPAAPTEIVTNDPFKDYLSNLSDLNRMSLKQMMNRTDQGQSLLKEGLKQQSKVFKSQIMPKYSDDELHHTRVECTDFAHIIKERSEKKKEELRKMWNPPSANVIAVMEVERKLYAHYGIKVKEGKNLTLQQVNKGLRDSLERTPQMKKWRKEEDQERKRQEVEDKARKFQEMQAAMRGPGPAPAAAAAGAPGEEEEVNMSGLFAGSKAITAAVQAAAE